MGYTTDFQGELKFASELTVSDLRRLNEILGEDIRKHPEWELDDEDFYYVDFELLKDYSGLKHSGAEKSYNAQDQVNAIITLMKLAKPDFGLEGALSAQGEEIGDVWTLQIVDGKAVKIDAPKLTDIYECPCCGRTFSLSKARKVTLK
jgi:hypothetical protein